MENVGFNSVESSFFQLKAGFLRFNPKIWLFFGCACFFSPPRVDKTQTHGVCRKKSPPNGENQKKARITEKDLNSTLIFYIRLYLKPMIAEEKKAFGFGIGTEWYESRIFLVYSIWFS